MKNSCDACGGMFSRDEMFSVDSVNLCGECKRLYESTELRPDMWQRLAYLIGPNHYLLCDSFYDDESGMPYEIEGSDKELEYREFAIDSSRGSSSAEEFAIHFFTRHLVWDGDFEELPEEWTEELFELCRSVVLDAGKDDDYASRAYHLLSLLPLRSEIHDFIKRRWGLDHQRCWFGIDSALVKHSSSEEAIEVLRESLLELEPDFSYDLNHIGAYYYDYLRALTKLGSREAIPAFREILAKREVPLLDKLGAYYRAMNPTWEDIKMDVLSGRPMSIVAIDALWIEHGNQFKKWFETRPLQDLSVPVDECRELMLSYLEADSAARVQSAVQRIGGVYNLGI